MNDPSVLRKLVRDLEIENKQLKSEKEETKYSDVSKTVKPQGQNLDRDWMNFQANVKQERPATASSMGAKVRELETCLKVEKKEKKKLTDEIDILKKDLQKQNFSAFTTSSGTVSASSGRLPPVPGVREISMDEVEMDEQIGQGGFSVIHKGTLNGTVVAIKKIFDPRLTDDLLNEIQNEIVMQSILRHPNIVLLMGVVPKIPDIVIVFEFMKDSLYNVLHLKKKVI